MAKKKDCEYGDEVSNGAKAGLTMFIVGLGASIFKRLGKKSRAAAARRKKGS